MLGRKKKSGDSWFTNLFGKAEGREATLVGLKDKTANTVVLSETTVDLTAQLLAESKKEYQSANPFSSKKSNPKKNAHELELERRHERDERLAGANERVHKQRQEEREKNTRLTKFKDEGQLKLNAIANSQKYANWSQKTKKVEQDINAVASSFQPVIQNKLLKNQTSPQNLQEKLQKTKEANKVFKHVPAEKSSRCTCWPSLFSSSKKPEAEQELFLRKGNYKGEFNHDRSRKRWW